MKTLPTIGIASVVASVLALGFVAIPSVVSTQTSTANLQPPKGYKASNLIFQDKFNRTHINHSHWNEYVTSRAADGFPWNGNTVDIPNPRPAANNLQIFSPQQLKVNNGLTLTAVRRGPAGSNQLWRSGVVSSYGHFEFNGGYLQVKAKVPTSSGMWPGIWMLPGPSSHHGDNFEIDVFEGGYTKPGTNPSNNYAWHLHTPRGTVGGVVATGEDLGSGYNTYGLLWVPGKKLVWYLNGTEIAHVTSSDAQIPNEPMELIIDLEVASPATNGWRTITNSTTPAGDVMQVAEVQVFS